MLEPKKLKHRKQHRNRGAFGGKATSGTDLAFGSVGLKCLTSGELTARQIEAARRAMTRSVQRGGKIWIRVFPHTPVTKKAAEVPMGAGKGSIEYYACIIRPGMILFEMDGLPLEAARTALTLASHKLPFQTKVVIDEHATFALAAKKLPMASTLTTTELRKMSAEDLRSEIREHRVAAGKTRLDLELKKEKNGAKAKTLRRAVARMLTVLGEKEREGAKLPLNKKSKTRTVPAPAAS